MTIEEMKQEFKEILLYGIQRGNEDQSLTADDLVDELTERIKYLFEKKDE